jgi:hypothetical protein
MTEDATILPWQPDTRQQQGRKTERRLVTEEGGVFHPSSGSGHVKQDGHNDHCLFEIKDAAITHRIDSQELMALYQRGVRQGLIPTYIVRFACGLILEGAVRMDSPGMCGA